jgi:hypothetical protein
MNRSIVLPNVHDKSLATSPTICTPSNALLSALNISFISPSRKPEMCALALVENEQRPTDPEQAIERREPQAAGTLATQD